jgi:RNA polymerase sigma-70 factor, ECF subfamily
MAQGDEQSLLKRAKSGDNDALLELFQGSLSFVTAPAWRVLHNEADVKDVVNETFLKALGGIARFREECVFSSWLYRIALRTAIDKLRDPHSRQTSITELESEDQGITQDYETPGAERAASIFDKVWEKLKPRQRTIIQLRLEEVPLGEIADRLGVGIGVVYAANKDFAKLCKEVRDELSGSRKPVPARGSP